MHTQSINHSANGYMSMVTIYYCVTCGQEFSNQTAAYQHDSYTHYGKRDDLMIKVTELLEQVDALLQRMDGVY